MRGRTICDPVTLTVLTIGAGLITAGGQMYAADAQSKQMKYEAAVATENRKLELEARNDTRKRGEMEQLRHWRKVAALTGEQRATMGAAGLDLGFGSPMDILDETAALGFEDASIIDENTNREARGYEIRAINYGNQAKGLKYGAKAAKTAGYIQAAGTLLGTASQVGKMWAGPSPGGGASPPSGGSSSSRYTSSYGQIGLSGP